MANLSTAGTKLGLFGYAAQSGGSFDRTTQPVVVLPSIGYATATDAVVTHAVASDEGGG